MTDHFGLFWWWYTIPSSQERITGYYGENKGFIYAATGCGNQF